MLLLLPLLVSGFLVCLNNRLIYHQLHRYEGQLLYLQVARYGIYCLITASAIIALLSASLSHVWPGVCLDVKVTLCVPAFSSDFLAALGNMLSAFGVVSDASSQLVAFAILSGLLAVAMPIPLARFQVWRVKRQQGIATNEVLHAFLLRESVSHSPLLSTLVEAFAERKEIMVSMEDRKVYVGYISSLGAPTEVAGIGQEIQLLPSVSGYRDKDDLKVVYTTEYSSSSVIFPIVFKQQNIISVTLFSQPLRAAFQALDAQGAPNSKSLPEEGLC